MTFLSTLFAPFYFTRVPATVLAVIFYALLFGSSFYTNYLPKVKQTADFERALSDLSNITARPHPFISHANDHVRSYLLSRIRSLSSDIEVIDDVNSTVKYAIDSTPPRSNYFEGTNILVKVPGSELNDSNAVLFSAHFDSVSTAPGATDNGIGLVGILQLLEHLVALPVDKRPKRTAIFNFNNNEEDGLLGAHAFLVHPWSNLTTTFLNVDGAGAGGRPMLFRTMSMAATAAFVGARPKTGYYRANILSQDAFGRGVVKSSTDWQVYGATMDGLDLAFYKNRAFYHTPLDSLAYAQGGARSLQAMIETIRPGGMALLNSDSKGSASHKDPVYFDILGRFMTILEMNSLFVINVVFLVVGPVIVIVFLAIDLALSSKRRAGHHESTASEMASFGASLWRLIKAVTGAVQFWLSLIVTAAAQVALILGYMQLNPYVVHSHSTLVLTSVMTLAYLTIVLPITVLQYTGISATKSKVVSTASTYFFTWILLVISTVYLQRSKIGGTYWVTIWNACAFVGLLLSLIQGLVAATTGGKLGGDATMSEEIVEDDAASVASTASSRVAPPKYVRGIEHQAESEGSREREEEVTETEPTEITPLIQQHQQIREAGRGYSDKSSEGDEVGWWFFQMIVMVPIPALLIYEIAIELLDALSQTLVDGSSVVTVYTILAILSTLILLPLTPFAHRMHGGLTWIMFILFAVTTLFCWFSSPFTQEAPMKFRFQQFVDLDSYPHNLLVQARSHTTINATTQITGLAGYVEQVIAALPSSRGKEVTCVPTAGGLTACAWQVEQKWAPSPGGDHSRADWVTSNVTRISEEKSTALISMRGKNTRGCRIYFDHAVEEYSVRKTDGDGEAGEVPAGYKDVPRDGIKRLNLWSRTWDRTFEVEVRWKHSTGMTGRVACEYAEYISGVAGGESDEEAWKSGRIPAYEEVLRFTPRWALVTKADDGLVEVWKRFSV